jgi:hypothetical protein
MITGALIGYTIGCVIGVIGHYVFNKKFRRLINRKFGI